MLYVTALQNILTEVLNSPDHQLLVSVHIPEIEPCKLFITNNGNAYKGNSGMISQQISMTLRQDIWSRYSEYKNNNHISDEPDFGSTLAVQKECLEKRLFFADTLRSIMLIWYRARQVCPE